MCQEKSVKKYLKGEIYRFVDNENLDKNNVSSDEHLLIGSRPVMIVKGGDDTSLVIPFTSNSRKRNVSVIHTNGVKSYAAFDNMKTINNSDIRNYLSTVVNPEIIINEISKYILNDSSESEEIILESVTFVAGQIWKKKEGPCFLIIKVLGNIDGQKGKHLLLGIALDQVFENNGPYDLEIAQYSKRLSVDMSKAITISSDDIDYYHGKVDDVVFNELRHKYIEFILSPDTSRNIVPNAIDMFLNKTSDYRFHTNEGRLHYQPTIATESETATEESTSAKETAHIKSGIKAKYTDDEKKFIAKASLNDIMEKFSLDSVRAFKLMREFQRSEQKSNTAKDSEKEGRKKKRYTDEEKKFIVNNDLEQICSKFSIDRNHAYKVKYYIENTFLKGIEELNESDISFIKMSPISQIQSRMDLSEEQITLLRRKYS